MKKVISSGILIAATILFVISCSKNNSNSGSGTSNLSLSNSSVAKGEPLIVSTDATGANYIKWSVSPASAGTWINATGNKSVILFSNSGSYKVTASYFTDSTAPTPYDSSSSPVTVTDSVYNDSSGQWAHCNLIEVVPISNNDQIFLTPISYSDTGLVLIAHTQLTYGSYYPMLNYVAAPDSVSGYEFSFGEVSQYPCNNSSVAPVPATGIITFGGATTPLINGTSDVTFILNGNIYKGTVTVTSTECTFSWNYTSGVTISPLSIQKQ